MRKNVHHLYILFTGVLSLKTLVNNSYLLRWTPGAQDICFTKQWHGMFLSRGRIVPIERGGGVYQTCMDFLVDKLNKGQWVHTFPEGGVCCLTTLTQTIRAANQTA